MPSVNFYTQQEETIERLQSQIPVIREFLATRLSCSDRKLLPDEVSIRLIRVAGGQMISPLEGEIIAFAYPERVAEQDLICRDVVDFLKRSEPSLPRAHIWLVLGELGHSWKE